MQIPVLVEPVAGNGYRATGGEPFALSAEGDTPDAALNKLRELIGQRVAGAIVVPLEVGAHTDAWAGGAGMFRDEPLFESWLKAIRTRRREIDQDPDVP